MPKTSGLKERTPLFFFRKSFFHSLGNNCLTATPGGPLHPSTRGVLRASSGPGSLKKSHRHLTASVPSPQLEHLAQIISGKRTERRRFRGRAPWEITQIFAVPRASLSGEACDIGMVSAALSPCHLNLCAIQDSPGVTALPI